MHPPDFRLQQRLSDWPDCVIEPDCSCGKRRMKTALPVKLLVKDHGNITFEALLMRLICSACRRKPAPVYLVAGHHRTFCHGGQPDWSVELVPVPEGQRRER